MKIAYVEDDADSLQIFARKFEADGIRCDSFENAEEALQNLRPGSHDLLISDIRLPGMSGVELLARLRERDVHTPCILITAFNNLALTKQALNTNANYLLEKPFTYQALKKIIQKTVAAPASLQHLADRGLEKIRLTSRENEIARLLLKGLSNSDIAKVLSISEATVKQFVSQILEKAGVASRAEFFSLIFPL